MDGHPGIRPLSQVAGHSRGSTGRDGSDRGRHALRPRSHYEGIHFEVEIQEVIPKLTRQPGIGFEMTTKAGWICRNGRSLEVVLKPYVFMFIVESACSLGHLAGASLASSKHHVAMKEIPSFRHISPPVTP